MSPLGRDITLVLLVKVALLFLLWWAFFRIPADSPLDTGPRLVAQRLLAPSSAPETAHADR